MEDERSLLIKEYDSRSYENEDNVIWKRNGEIETVKGRLSKYIKPLYVILNKL